VGYSVKEIVYTLQGEGANAGRPAVFCRFTGCNLWSGREQDRASAVCKFCDTDFLGTDGPSGGRFADAQALARRICRIWGEGLDARFVVFTGGEPLLQLDDTLTTLLHKEGFRIAVETNGTLDPPPGIDWICMSPKSGAPLRLRRGDELKLVFPQAGLDPSGYLELDFRHFFLQAMDGPDLRGNLAEAVAYCLEHPRWRLSVQTHKMIGIP
jgi:7-carboxy-7-deazaguanine synthase